jgi:hypothetical protein
MNTHRHRWNAMAWITAAACISGFVFAVAACESDEPVGHSRTTTKSTVVTPDGQRETTTTIHDKNTEVYPK